MANEITGSTSVSTAMRVDAGRQKVAHSEGTGKPQPVERQNLPRGVNEKDTAKKPDGLEQAVDRINNMVQNTQRDLLFSIDEGSGRTKITVLDSQTKEVIRQIPSEDVLNMVEHLKGATSGLLFSTDV